MLYGVPEIITPDLLKVMMEMGHGDEIVLADANFPAASHTSRLIRCDGHAIPLLLDAILHMFPLDKYVERPVAIMQIVPGDLVETPIWETYMRIIEQRTGFSQPLEKIERFEFYERTKRAYAVVATGEKALYANIILKKGVIA